MGNYLLQNQPAEDPAVMLVCVLGVAVVFLGLILLVGLVKVMNAFLDKKYEEKAANSLAGNNTMKETTVPAANTSSATIENKQEIIAAVCAAIAEENGTDISAIRVISFKKL